MTDYGFVIIYPESYDFSIMTELLEQAIGYLKSLDADRQDMIASLIMEELEDDAKWDAAFSSSQNLLANLAAEAMDEYNTGYFASLFGSR